ncbi:hypothetical protein C8R41DRAFT_872425 [Lentinula lateritia]|uniref:Uncharacterized protein n=1 Tax=Lentinula lateritia TaxID=40482 RepID=A0ABQ8UW03_9AGAR|nr:hypothetical protein C8R41DRAFT_872425 [Lentinula lateritia]
MAVRTLQVLTDDSSPVESAEVYNIFEEASPFLVYIHDFWMGRANCPLFAEWILLTAECLAQQWGIPPEHQSTFQDASDFEHFPTIPIPFCLRFREGSAMIRLVPSAELDPFASLRSQGVLSGNPSAIPPSNTSETLSPPPATKAPVVPPRALRRNCEIEGLKADASTFFSSPRPTRSKDSDNELLSGFPSVGSAPRASLSTKVSVGSKEPKSKTTIKPPIPLLLVWLTKGFDFLLVRGKSRQLLQKANPDK